MKVAVIMRHCITNYEDKVMLEVDAPSFRAFLTNEEILLKVLNDDEIMRISSFILMFKRNEQFCARI